MPELALRYHRLIAKAKNQSMPRSWKMSWTRWHVAFYTVRQDVLRPPLCTRASDDNYILKGISNKCAHKTENSWSVKFVNKQDKNIQNGLRRKSNEFYISSRMILHKYFTWFLWFRVAESQTTNIPFPVKLLSLFAYKFEYRPKIVL